VVRETSLRHVKHFDEVVVELARCVHNRIDCQ
jgi:hypothetical protein